MEKTNTVCVFPPSIICSWHAYTKPQENKNSAFIADERFSLLLSTTLWYFCYYSLFIRFVQHQFHHLVSLFSFSFALFLFYWQAIWMTCAMSAIGLDFCYRIFPFLRNSSLAHVQSENRRLMMVNRVSYTAYT